MNSSNSNRFPPCKLAEFALSTFEHYDFLSTFGCYHMEVRVMNEVNQALCRDQLPTFQGDWSCYCQTDRCNWDEEKIITRLKEVGIWQAIETKLAFRKWHKR